MSHITIFTKVTIYGVLGGRERPCSIAHVGRPSVSQVIQRTHNPVSVSSEKKNKIKSATGLDGNGNFNLCMAEAVCLQPQKTLALQLPPIS